MNTKEFTELRKEEEMKPNDLNYLKLVRDMNDMLENDFCMDMNCKLHLHGGRDKNSFTQEEAQQMADLIGKLYTLSHYWYCHCGLGKGYELTKTTQSNDEIKREALKEKAELLDALAGMWDQYCGERGHSWMGAGEHASELLIKYGLLKDAWSSTPFIEDYEEYLTQKENNE